jgi:BirA family transcriptional regulator, biotin operon repressor / biotin---[acetyl-CoA-carboxylase] ligase
MNTDKSGSFHLAQLRRGLKPFRLYWFARLRSTNDHAALLRKRGDLFAPAVVLAGHQVAGRGRGSNAWWSGPGCLTATFVFPAGTTPAAHHLPLVAGLATRNAAAELAGCQDIQLKWPNDLLYRGRKLAGLLCEGILKADIVGIGLNVNLEPSSAPRALRKGITSLSQIAGRQLDMTQALVAVARHLDALLLRPDKQPFSQQLRAYDAHHALVGRRVTVIDGTPAPAVSGRCEGLDSMGRLLLRNGPTLHHVIAGHVRMD